MLCVMHVKVSMALKSHPEPVTGINYMLPQCHPSYRILGEMQVFIGLAGSVKGTAA